MKIITKIICLLVLSFLVTSCNSNTKNQTLYILNVGDYINYDLLTKFEKENNIEVIITEVESNEAMYEQIKSQRTTFDIAFPSDYMIEQLDQEKLLNNIDFTRLKNYSTKNISSLTRKYGPSSDNYVPYFNGTLGIMYNTKKIKDIDKIISKHGWDVLFDENLLKGGRIAMYNSSRDAFASALLAKNLSVNTTDPKKIDIAFNMLKNANFEMYGDDNLKKNVVTGNLDASLVYSGDFFEELIVANDEETEVNFSFYAPKNNNYWVDGIVIPAEAKNTELAYKFLDFMLDEDNAVENAEYIGYPSALTNVMKVISSKEEYNFLTDNPYFDPNTREDLNAESFKFLGLDYMTKLEELFTKSKSK